MTNAYPVGFSFSLFEAFSPPPPKPCRIILGALAFVRSSLQLNAFFEYPGHEKKAKAETLTSGRLGEATQQQGHLCFCFVLLAGLGFVV